MILRYNDKVPQIDKSVFIAEDSTVIGNVEIGENSSIWYHAVLRGDINFIKIGRNTNIQDGTICHVDLDEGSLIIGDNVTVGHNAILHGAKIGNNCLIGMGAIILTGAKIGDNCIIGAGSLITENKVISERSLVLGIPGKTVRKVTEEEIKKILESSRHYIQLAQQHKKKLIR